MSVDFLNSPCREASRNDELFGLCDDQNNTRAYSDVANQFNWIANVINDDQVDVVFTPIDNCIVVHKPGTQDQESLCDGMLISDNSLFLVELKDQITGGWLPKASEQLEITLNLLLASHNLSGFRYKKAFQCNKKHRAFKTIDNEENLRMFRTYGFRWDTQGKIVIR